MIRHNPIHCLLHLRIYLSKRGRTWLPTYIGRGGDKRSPESLYQLLTEVILHHSKGDGMILGHRKMRVIYFRIDDRSRPLLLAQESYYFRWYFHILCQHLIRSYQEDKALGKWPLLNLLYALNALWRIGITAQAPYRIGWV